MKIYLLWRYTAFSYPSYRIIHAIVISHYLFLVRVNLRCRLKILKQKFEKNIKDIKKEKNDILQLFLIYFLQRLYQIFNNS